MIPLPPSNEQAFFEIAATLIPLLLLGGVLLDRLPRTAPSPRFVAYTVIAAVVVIVGEVLAILVLVRGSSSTFDRFFVAFVLVGGMFAVIAAVVVPWLSLATPTPRSRCGPTST
jgi:hypothetical protein